MLRLLRAGLADDDLLTLDRGTCDRSTFAEPGGEPVHWGNPGSARQFH
jgi:hypothetical protein